MLLTIQVDEVGEPITFGTENTDEDGRKTFGTLQPGETYTILLHKIRGVFANVFSDFGPAFTVLDVDGARLVNVPIMGGPPNPLPVGACMAQKWISD